MTKVLTDRLNGIGSGYRGYRHGVWPENIDGQPFFLGEEFAFTLAVEKSFANGLFRHHAHDDAKAKALLPLRKEALR